MQGRKPGPLSRFWMGLNPRERSLVSWLVVVIFAMSTLLLLVLRSSELRKAERDIDKMKRALEMVYREGPSYQKRLDEKEARESRISAQPLVFSTLLEEATTLVDGVSVTNQEEQTPTDLGGGLRRRSVEFELKDVTLEQLTRFLAAVESKPGHVIFTDRIRIRSGSSQEDVLSARMEVATWERTPEATTEEEGS